MPAGLSLFAGLTALLISTTALAQIDIEVPDTMPTPRPRLERVKPRATPAPTPEPTPEPTPLPSPPPAIAEPTPTPVPSPTPIKLPIVSPTATPIPVPVPMAVPTATPKISDLKTLGDLKVACERHFPGAIQAEVRAACTAAGNDFEHLGRPLVETRCRLHYGEEPRLVMSCLIGASIASDLVSGHQEFKRKLQLCAETYPVQNEIDAFLQESCLTGVYIPEWMESDRNPDRAAICAQITPERSFIGPCAVGLSLIQDDVTAVPPSLLSKSCAQYFDSVRFHKGYRACANARSLSPQVAMKVSEVIKICSNISSEANNEVERAACFVGLDIYRHLVKKEDVSARFQKCGTNKVTYQDRDFLACLTAASLLDFTDKNGADSGCREIFKEGKSRSRSDCANSLSLF